MHRCSILLLAGGGSFVWGILLLLFGTVAGFSILWSLVPRRQDLKAPGVLLDLNQQPGLAAEIQAVATALGEPMPREVYVIGQANPFVAERGGFADSEAGAF